MNYGTLAGHLGADPEVRFTSNGKKVITLRVAARARKDETIWWKVTIWGDQFDNILQHFKKGSSIVVTGEIAKPEIFNDREGKPQISMQMTAHNISFSPFGKGKSGEEGGSHQAAPSQNFNVGGGYGEEVGTASFGASRDNKDFSDDEIPF